VTGEFANIGVVLYSPEQRFLEARFAVSYERLNAIFLKIDHLHYRALMRYMANRFEEIAADLRDGLHIRPLTALSEIVRQVLPPDDSSLQWSEQGGGFTEDPSKTLDELYKRVVERYVAGVEQVSRSDEEVAKPFKARLGRTVEKLAAKTIETKDYQYDFRFAWKNQIWHLYEPVSFDLVDPGSIREKANNGWGAAWRCTMPKRNSKFISFWANRVRMRPRRRLKTQSISWAKSQGRRNSCARTRWSVSRRMSLRKSAVTSRQIWFCGINRGTHEFPVW